MDRFLLVENPMHQEPHKIYILHAISPRCLIECIPVYNEKDREVTAGDVEIKELFILNKFVNSDRLPEYWKLVINDFYDHKSTSDVILDGEAIKKYYKVLEKAWRWYRAYLEWEDNNIDETDFAQQN